MLWSQSVFISAVLVAGGCYSANSQTANSGAIAKESTDRKAAVQSSGNLNFLLLGSTLLTLGMPQERVLEKLGKEFNIVHADTQGSTVWLVTSKDDPNGGGYVEFQDGKLKSAAHDWANSDADSFTFAGAFYGLAKQLGDERLNKCELVTSNSQNPSVIRNDMNLLCHGKQIRLSTYEFLSGERKGLKLAYLQEVLE